MPLIGLATQFIDAAVALRRRHTARAALYLLTATLTANVQAQSGAGQAAALRPAATTPAPLVRPAALQIDLQGILSGGKAVLSVNGGASRVLASGQSLDDMKLLAVDGDSITIEINGKRERIVMGSAPYRAPVAKDDGSAGATGKAVLSADSRGHFVTTGYVNGKTQQFLVDTGASIVAISSFDAKRIGMNMTNARTVQANTANGMTYGLAVKADSLRIGDITLFNIEVWVLDNLAGPALLGNSFLNRLSMTRDAGTLVLTKRF
jgi:aspartyl protease family protein